MLKYNKIIIMIVAAMVPAIVFAEWQSLGGPPAGRADDMSIGEYLGTYYLYAADKKHRLYRSINLGAEWDSIYELDTDNPTCVLTEKDDGWIVYIGRQDDNPEQRVMKSTDWGQSWDDAGGTNPNWITNPYPLCFAMDPNDASIVYLGCAVGACGVFKTDDGGETWDEKPLPTSPVNPMVNEIAITTTDPAWIFAGCSGKNTDDGIWQSTNGGIDWNQQMSDDDIYSVEFANQSVGYAGSDGDPYGIYKTTNGGTNWNPLPNSPSYWTRDLIAINTNTIYAATGAGIYKTTDGGGTWVPKNNGILIKTLSSIIVHPNDVQTLFTGEKMSVYKTVDGGDQWSDKSQGYKCYKMLSVSSVTPYLYTIGDRTRDGNFMIVSISTDCGTNWYATRITPASAPEEPFYVEVDYSAPERALAGCYRLSGTIDQNEGGQIYRTLNAGYSWNFSYSPSANNSTAYLYGIRTNTSSSDWVYAGYNYAYDQYGFMRNGRFGQYGYWEAAVSGLGTNSVRCIAVDQEVWNMIYVGTSANGVYKSTNNGNNWVQTELDDKRVNALAIDIDYPDTIYAGSEDDYGIYKTTDGFASADPANNGLDYLYISDLEIDPSEPTIVYTLCKENESAEETHVYCTVDRAGKWFDVGDGLPNEYVSDLEIDLDGTEPVHAATEQGVYTYTPDFNKSLVSSSDKASSYNNGRKMVRNGNDIWITYESGGVVYVVHSDDNGQSWSKKREMGKGYNPCMGIKLIQSQSEPTLGVVWWAQGTRDTLYFSKYSSGSWGAPTAIVTSNNDFSPPSFVLHYSDYGHMVYVEGGSYIKYTKFDINGESEPQTYDVDTGDNENPSIGYMSSLGNPEIHIVYKSGGRLYYKSRTGSTWNDREFIILGGTHPCLEVVGTVVHIVCHVANNIRHYYTVYTGGPRDWNEEQVNNSNDYSDYPVITSGSACAWVENVGGTNKEIYFSIRLEYGWTGPMNISNTASSCSDYPHIVHKQTGFQTTIYFAWTERNSAPFDVKFTSQVLGGGERGEDPDLMFYLADAGENVASPFNRRRESYTQYGPEFFKKIDYDSEYLEYQFEGLSSENEYALTVYAYQQDFSNLNITVKADNAELAKITIPEDTLIMCKKMLPIEVYADSMVNVKIFGEKALCAALVLHEYEEESKGGGPQSSETMLTQFGQLTLSTYPNPTKKAVRIEYNLPAKMGVKLSIYDVTGRLVKNIVNENQDASFYHESFDMTDLSQGVYFVKLNTGDKSIIEKVIFLR